MAPFLMIFLGDFLMTIYSAMGGLKAVVDGHYTVGVDYFEDISKVQKQHGLAETGKRGRSDSLK